MISFDEFLKQDEADKYNMLQECNAIIQQKENIIKEVREILKYHLSNPSQTERGWHIDIWNSEDISRLDKHLEILDKENK